MDDAALFLGRLERRRDRDVRGDPVRDRQENAIRVEANGFDRQPGVRPRAAQRAGVPRRHRGRRAQGFRRVVVTEPGHPYLSGWYLPGHTLGWGETFVHEIADLVPAIGAGTDPLPSFEDGLHVQLVLDAVQRSAAGRSTARSGGTVTLPPWSHRVKPSRFLHFRPAPPPVAALHRVQDELHMQPILEGR